MATPEEQFIEIDGQTPDLTLVIGERAIDSSVRLVPADPPIPFEEALAVWGESDWQDMTVEDLLAVHELIFEYGANLSAYIVDLQELYYRQVSPKMISLTQLINMKRQAELSPNNDTIGS